MKKTLLFVLVATLLAACNQTVELYEYEDTPKVAEHVMKMTSQQAIAYLQKQGFFFNGEANSSNQSYIFSKDPKLSEFSYDASIMLGLNVVNDTVHSVGAVQQMDTEQSARDLFYKWSLYTAKTTFPSPQDWRGLLLLKDSNTSMSYCGGVWVEQAKEAAKQAYESGRFTKEEYDEMMAIYARTQDLYWTDYQKAGNQLDAAEEQYRNVGPDYPTKEINLLLFMNNGGHIELRYQTRDYNIFYFDTESN